MGDYPATEEQVQELRKIARRIYAGEGVRRIDPSKHIGFVAVLLGASVLEGGRLADTVSFAVRYQIAKEEQENVCE